MSLKFPPVVEAWRYKDPAEICEASMRFTERQASRASSTREGKDRYYTQARRVEVKRAMRGKR